MHPAGHAGLSLVDLGLTVDAFGALLFFLFNFALVHRNSASYWNLVRFERRTLTLRIETGIRVSVAFRLHLGLITFPEREWLFTLFGNLEGLLLNFKTTFLIFVLDLLVPGNEDSCRDRLASELVGHHALFFHLLFHDHSLNFALSDSLGLDGFTRVEFEWKGYCNAIFALFLGLRAFVVT